VLPNHLRLALKRLNPELLQEALDDAFSTLTRERGAIDPTRANAEIYKLLREGVQVDVRGAEGDRIKETVGVIDWETPQENDFFLASHGLVRGRTLYEGARRPRWLRQRDGYLLKETEWFLKL
jgi:type I restriction enzyme, R subunit